MESMMMADNEDRPINLVQEVDQPQENDVVSRSYECIFCKRGFTTAQALGGHMNIHRKDRAKTKPNYLMSNTTTFNSTTHDEVEHSCYAGPRFYQPVFASYPPTSYTSSSPANYHQDGAQIRYTSYFESTSNNSWPVNHENNHHQAFHGVITSSPSREEKRMSLSLQFGWSLDQEDRDSKRNFFRDEDKEDDLDLELRLGHDP